MGPCSKRVWWQGCGCGPGDPECGVALAELGAPAGSMRSSVRVGTDFGRMSDSKVYGALRDRH